MSNTTEQMELESGTKVRLKENPTRIGVVGNEHEHRRGRCRYQVHFFDGTVDHYLASALDIIREESNSPNACIRKGLYATARNLRTTITHHRLSGRLANLIYSLNTTNTDYYPHQFKPVLQLLDSPSDGILIADEVGLGKTIEAGLIWIELKARFDARRLLVVCPAVLRTKWRDELLHRFGIKAEVVNADELHNHLQNVRQKPRQEFALIASMQGLRPPADYLEPDNQKSTARLARFLEDIDPAGESLLNLLIIDEAHYLRNSTTSTNTLGHLLRPHTDYLALLSATPLQTSDTDLFNLLKLLDESAFPHEYIFEQSMSVTRPIVQLRDAVLAGRVNRKEFCSAVQEAMDNQFLEDSAQLHSLLHSPPSNEELKSPASRAEIADRLDRVHPLSKVVTRTLKREVQENRVIREPQDYRARLTEAEESFYKQVTARVREYCQENDLLTGFILTTPQRQMSSSMPAACRAWQEKISSGRIAGLDEALYELSDNDAMDENEAAKAPELGSLVEQLMEIARSVGDYEELKKHDSKYKQLRKNLHKYFKDNPDNKVVLFSFFRQTLAYLKERLLEEGFSCIVMQGGDNKDETLAAFKDSAGPQILLSSEVGSEGVDLQFSSLLINYDLPWNPMRIEQRIGRIDRLGQQAAKILIWNFMYANTIDERIYDRLLMRLDVFRQALGSMESIMGRVIKTLTSELLTHHLTPEQEEQRIEQNVLALEENRRRQKELENEAPHLVAHGSFITDKVKAAEELGRYIGSDDLHAYVSDFIHEHYGATRLTPLDDESRKYEVELDTALAVDLDYFIQNNGLQGQTQLLSSRPRPLLFENRHQTPSPAYERVTQDHPLVRFVTQRSNSHELLSKRFPMTAVQLPATALGTKKLLDHLEPGVYVFSIAQWSFSGAQTSERLVYAVIPLEGDVVLNSDTSEKLMNVAALEGDDWPSAPNVLDAVAVGDAYEDCIDRLSELFAETKKSMEDENSDRINLLIKLLQDRQKLEISRIEERIHNLRESGKNRMIPAEKGKRKKVIERCERRVAELQRKKKLVAETKPVMAGVLFIS